MATRFYVVTDEPATFPIPDVEAKQFIENDVGSIQEASS